MSKRSTLHTLSPASDFLFINGVVKVFIYKLPSHGLTDGYMA